MDVFLFLYPIKPYIDFALQRSVTPGVSGVQFEFFHRLIKERYRDLGYRVAWLLFSEGLNRREMIDDNIVDPRIIFQPEDSLVSAGVPFADSKEAWVYPEEEFIFSQLPKNISSLRLGGFHYSDCVGRVARYAYEDLKLADKVLVDEDLVQWFWSVSAKMFDPALIDLHDPEDPRSTIPTHRDLTYEGFGYTLYKEWETDPWWIHMREQRSKHPWYMHK